VQDPRRATQALTAHGGRFPVDAVERRDAFLVNEAAAAADLPERLRHYPRSVRAVYRVVHDLRAADPGRTIEPRHAHAEWERRAGDFFGLSTVGHALTTLRRLGLLVRRLELGWTLAPEGPRPG
jgi:hypothetical protein